MPAREGEMRTVRGPGEATRRSLEVRRSGRTVGLVPTMGALHEGHRSLIRRARDECDWVGVSIFVNPTQFGPDEDLESYPRPVERDLAIAEEDGVDLVLAPGREEMYPGEHTTWVEVGGLSQKLEGMSRPGHFRGVTTVVAKLLNIFQPDRAYFGQKDLQQLVTVRRMARDLNFPVEIVCCPIVREPDGLAMSSRNANLSEAERKSALCLHEALGAFTRAVEEGERDAPALMATMAERIIAEPGAVLDYAAVVDPSTLEDLATVEGEAAAAVAAWIGNTRLIDNEIVRV